MVTKGVWDTNDVYELNDILRTSTIEEAMLGWCFQIIGVKG